MTTESWAFGSSNGSGGGSARRRNAANSWTAAIWLRLMLGTTAHALITVPASSGCERLVDRPSLSFEAVPLDQAVRAGSAFNLTCTVFAVPQPVAIEWLHNDELVQLDKVESGAEILLPDVESSSAHPPSPRLGAGLVESRLHVPCARKKHAGRYTCRVISACVGVRAVHADVNVLLGSGGEEGKHFLTTHLPDPKCPEPQASPPVIRLSTVSRLEALRQPVRLVCRADGLPRPTISWSIVDDDTQQPVTLPLDGSRTHMGDTIFEQLPSGDLIVLGGGPAHVLRCTATNELGQDQTDATLVLIDSDDESDGGGDDDDGDDDGGPREE